MRQLYFL